MGKIDIIVKNVTSQLSDYTEELEKALSVYYENYWFMKGFKQHAHDGKYHFLKIPSLRFPTGLLFIVKEIFENQGIDYKIIDMRTIPVSEKSLPMALFDQDVLKGITLHDFQFDAILEALLAGRGVLELPTGSGKTEIAIGITKALGLKTLFMVHKKDLLYQTWERFKKRLDTEFIGLVGDSEVKNEGCNITIAMIQTLDSLLKKNPEGTKKALCRYEMIFQDECHHSSAKSWYKVGMYCHRAYYRYGLSGTPLRRDNLSNMKVMALTGPVIYKLPTTKLIDEGYLSNIEVKIITNPEKVIGTSWQSIYEKGIVWSAVRNSLITNLSISEFKKNKKIMILVRRIEHGERLRDMLETNNIPTIFLFGAHSSEEREKIKKEFNTKGDFVLIASPIFDEGVDLPEINVLINGAAGKSEVRTIQFVGRGLRKKKDDSILTVYDFMDKSKYIEKHSVKRIQTYEKEGFSVTEIQL